MNELETSDKIYRSTAKRDFELTDEELDCLDHVSVQNPYFVGRRSKLYVREEVERLAASEVVAERKKYRQISFELLRLEYERDNTWKRYCDLLAALQRQAIDRREAEEKAFSERLEREIREEQRVSGSQSLRVYQE